jgi:hypothetical protein
LGVSVGEVPERPKGTDCKSVGDAFGGSNPPLSTRFTILEMGGGGEPFSTIFFPSVSVDSSLVGGVAWLFVSHRKAIQTYQGERVFDFPEAILKSGSSSDGRASAFQAEGRGFDPRFPLHFIRTVLLAVISDSIGQPVVVY